MRATTSRNAIADVRLSIIESIMNWYRYVFSLFLMKQYIIYMVSGMVSV